MCKFSGIQYMRRVPSHGIQTVICSAFHGILSFWLFCHHVDSKNVSYLSCFLVLRPLCNKPFGSVRALRTFTGLTVPGHNPRAPPTSHMAQDSIAAPPWLSVPQYCDSKRGWWSRITFLSPVYVKLFLWKEWLHEQGVFIPEERWLGWVWNMFSWVPWRRWAGMDYSLCLPVQELKSIK